MENMKMSTTKASSSLNIKFCRHYPGCKNPYVSNLPESQKNKRFFCFPRKPLISWQRACNIDSTANCTNLRICREQFSLSDFNNTNNPTSLRIDATPRSHINPVYGDHGYACKPESVESCSEGSVNKLDVDSGKTAELPVTPGPKSGGSFISLPSNYHLEFTKKSTLKTSSSLNIKFHCRYPSCHNYYARNLPKDQKNMRFFCFPKNPSSLSSWQKACNIDSSFNCSNLHICQDHFSLSDFNNPNNPITLRIGAIPRSRINAVNDDHGYACNSKSVESCTEASMNSLDIDTGKTIELPVTLGPKSGESCHVHGDHAYAYKSESVELCTEGSVNILDVDSGKITELPVTPGPKSGESFLSLPSDHQLEFTKMPTIKTSSPLHIKFHCRYPSCHNYYARYLPKDQKNMRFFCFPKKPSSLRSWQKACNIDSSVNCSNLHICQDHFSLSDYNNPNNPTRLRIDAIPRSRIDILRNDHNYACKAQSIGHASRPEA